MTSKKSAGAKFRAEYEKLYEPEHPGEAAVLERVCRLLDGIEQMEAAVGRDGVTIQGSKGLVAHPLLAPIRQHSETLGRLIARLNLEDETPAQARARNAARVRWDRK